MAGGIFLIPELNFWKSKARTEPLDYGLGSGVAGLASSENDQRRQLIMDRFLLVSNVEGELDGCLLGYSTPFAPGLGDAVRNVDEHYLIREGLVLGASGRSRRDSRNTIFEIEVVAVKNLNTKRNIGVFLETNHIAFKTEECTVRKRSVPFNVTFEIGGQSQEKNTFVPVSS